MECFLANSIYTIIATLLCLLIYLLMTKLNNLWECVLQLLLELYPIYLRIEPILKYNWQNFEYSFLGPGLQCQIILPSCFSAIPMKHMYRHFFVAVHNDIDHITPLLSMIHFILVWSYSYATQLLIFTKAYNFCQI